MCTAYSLSILALPLNAAREVPSSHIGTLALSETVVHQAVAEPDALL